MPEDIVITSSKSNIEPYRHGQDTDCQKIADGWTDGLSALYSRYIYIYIHIYYTSIGTCLTCRTMLHSFSLYNKVTKLQYHNTLKHAQYWTQNHG